MTADISSLLLHNAPKGYTLVEGACYGLEGGEAIKISSDELAGVSADQRVVSTIWGKGAEGNQTQVGIVQAGDKLAVYIGKGCDCCEIEVKIPLRSQLGTDFNGVFDLNAEPIVSGDAPEIANAELLDEGVFKDVGMSHILIHKVQDITGAKVPHNCNSKDHF